MASAFLASKESSMFWLVEQLDLRLTSRVETQPALQVAVDRLMVQRGRRQASLGPCRGHRAEISVDSSLDPPRASLALGSPLQELFSRSWEF